MTTDDTYFNQDSFPVVQVILTTDWTFGCMTLTCELNFDRTAQQFLHIIYG